MAKETIIVPQNASRTKHWSKTRDELEARTGRIVDTSEVKDELHRQAHHLNAS